MYNVKILTGNVIRPLESLQPLISASLCMMHFTVMYCEMSRLDKNLASLL